jgi:hypothetical protein
MVELTKRLMAKHTDDPLFRGPQGRRALRRRQVLSEISQRRFE